jgi:hypothetical protein
MFLFELVTGKPPSWRPSGSGDTIREILLAASEPDKLLDKLPTEDSHWPASLFFVGKDCSKELRRRRPLMIDVFSTLEQLNTNHNVSTPIWKQYFSNSKLLILRHINTSTTKSSIQLRNGFFLI